MIRAKGGGYLPSNEQGADRASGDASLCFDCGTRPATPGRPLVVHMYRVAGQSGTNLAFKEVQVDIPICEGCRAEETSIELRRNQVIAACSLIPLVAGVIFGIAQGEFLPMTLFGLGMGFFLGLVARATVGHKRRSREHPEIKSLLKRDWSFERPGT